MAIMLAKTYAAFKAAGAPEDAAQAAAEELADYQNRFSSIDHELVLLGGRFDAVDGRMSGVEDRLVVVENRLGTVENRLGIVENRLGIVESRLGIVENRLGVVESRLVAVEGRLAEMAGKMTVLTWAVGINAAATIAILGVLLRGH